MKWIQSSRFRIKYNDTTIVRSRRLASLHYMSENRMHRFCLGVCNQRFTCSLFRCTFLCPLTLFHPDRCPKRFQFFCCPLVNLLRRVIYKRSIVISIAPQFYSNRICIYDSFIFCPLQRCTVINIRKLVSMLHNSRPSFARAAQILPDQCIALSHLFIIYRIQTIDNHLLFSTIVY